MPVGLKYPGHKPVLGIAARRLEDQSFVLLELVLPQQRDGAGYWLPARVLTESSRGLWSAYVAKPLAAPRGEATHRIARRLLEVTHQEADRVFVRGALRDGDAVVAEGIQRLVPGQLVRPVAKGA